MGVLALLPILGVLGTLAWRLARTLLDRGRIPAGELGMAGGMLVTLVGLMVMGMVLIDRLRERTTTSTSEPASPLPALVVILLGVGLTTAAMFSR